MGATTGEGLKGIHTFLYYGRPAIVNTCPHTLRKEFKSHTQPSLASVPHRRFSSVYEFTEGK